MRVYFDACCYNRPFDDQGQDRVRIEKEAILSIMNRVTVIGSDVLDLELSRIPQPEKREKVARLYMICREKVTLDNDLQQRARGFVEYGIQPFDALHMAAAERANVDALLTTDDRFIKAAQRPTGTIRVCNPIDWLMEGWR